MSWFGSRWDDGAWWEGRWFDSPPLTDPFFHFTAPMRVWSVSAIVEHTVFQAPTRLLGATAAIR